MDRFGNMTNSEIKSLIDEHIRGTHAERNREIVKRRLIDGITFEALADEVDMSTIQVRRIFYQCEKQLPTA